MRGEGAERLDTSLQDGVCVCVYGGVRETAGCLLNPGSQKLASKKKKDPWLVDPTSVDASLLEPLCTSMLS